MSTLQTLERGLTALQIIARQPGRLTVAQLGAEMGIHRTIAYRIVRTLQAAGYLHSDISAGLRLGKAIPMLFAAFSLQLPPNSQRVLDDLARDTAATSALVAADGEECVALQVAAFAEGPLQVAYRIGSRHPITLGASGVALCSLQPPRPDEPEPVTRARAQGYALSEGVLQQGAYGIFMPLPELAMAVGIVAMRPIEVETTLPILTTAAKRLMQS